MCTHCWWIFRWSRFLWVIWFHLFYDCLAEIKRTWSITIICMAPWKIKNQQDWIIKVYLFIFYFFYFWKFNFCVCFVVWTHYYSHLYLYIFNSFVPPCSYCIPLNNNVFFLIINKSNFFVKKRAFFVLDLSFHSLPSQLKHSHIALSPPWPCKLISLVAVRVKLTHRNKRKSFPNIATPNFEFWILDFFFWGEMPYHCFISWFMFGIANVNQDVDNLHFYQNSSSISPSVPNYPAFANLTFKPEKHNGYPTVLFYFLNWFILLLTPLPYCIKLHNTNVLSLIPLALQTNP